MADGYRVVRYQGFGGLNLREVRDPTQAIDLLNVLFHERDAVAQRSGFAKFTSTAGTNRYDSLTPFYKSDGTRQLVAGAGNRLEALTTAGAVLKNTTTTASPHYFARFGGPTGEHLYIANGKDTVRRWTGAAFETPTYDSDGVTPKGKFLGLSVTDNRLINARFSGTTAGNNPSTVRFSDEGDPLTWGNTNYVDLQPGDGEEIMGIVMWRDITLVFKQSKFFVFYGNSPDDNGDPVFNNRPVDAGVGLAAPQAVAVGEQGVFFADRSGIYVTTSREPKRISDLVEPIFHGTPSTYYQGGVLNDAAIDKASMVYYDGRLWFSFPSGSATANDRQLVLDPATGVWSLTDFPAGPMTSFRVGDVEELVFGYSSGTNHLGRYVEGENDDDDGSAITARWQGGWLSYGLPAVKVIREAKLSGTGTVTLKWYRDFKTTAEQSVERELSTTDAIQTKSVRKAVRGAVFSAALTNSTLDKTFKVYDLAAHLRNVRVPSVVDGG